MFLLPEGVLGVNDGVFRDARLPLAHTDAEGAFRLPSARRGGQLVAYAEGRIPSALSLDDASLDEPIELVLREARTITVRVEGPQAHWPARCGAAIRTDYDQTWERTADPTRLAYIAFVDPQEEPQDVEQTLQVPTLAPLRVELRLPAGWASVPRRVDLSSGVDRAEFRLVPSGELRVRVIDDVTGEPPATGSHVGMTIQEVGVQHPIWNRATIGGNELHERSRLTPGHYGVEVAVSGYLPARVPFEISSKGAKVDLVVRVVPRDLDDTGRVLLRVIDTERAPGNVRALARSGAPPGFAAEYVAFLRASGTTQWTGANAKVLEDGRVDLRPRLLETWQSGVRPGHYDLYVARRDTGTAAYIPGVRVFGDEEKEVTVTLQPGTLFRVTDLASDEEPLTEMTVSAAGIGQLPMVEFRADGHWTLTTPADAEYLLARPLQPRILGPFPAEEIEISVTTESGKERLVRIRGASILR